MNLTLMYFMLIMTLAVVMAVMMASISKKSIMDNQKSTPFECGFNPMSNKRLPFSIHFFLIAVIFLIFDIEIIIVFPMIMSMKFCITKAWIMSTLLMATILIIGLYNEWYQGMLKWTN